MKDINIAKIEINNPILSTYVKTIRSWGGEDLQLTENGFYAIFLEDRFLAASTMEANDNNSDILISLVNGSNVNHEIIQKESQKQLSELAKIRYGENKTIKMLTLSK